PATPALARHDARPSGAGRAVAAVAAVRAVDAAVRARRDADRGAAEVRTVRRAAAAALGLEVTDAARVAVAVDRTVRAVLAARGARRRLERSAEERRRIALVEARAAEARGRITAARVDAEARAVLVAGRGVAA